MASITYHLANKNRHSRLRLYFSYKPGISAKTIRLRFSTPYKISPANWNKSKQRASGKEAYKINSKLTAYESKILDYFTSNPTASADELTQAIQAIITPDRSENEQTVSEVLQQYVDLKKASAKTQTYLLYKRQLDELRRYNNVITFAEIKTPTFWQQYQGYLLQKQTVFGKGLRNKSIVVKIKALERMLKWSVKAGFTDSIAELSDIVPEKTSDMFVLSQDEIMQIRAAAIPAKLHSTRDIFLFQFYTGQRYSDICRLEKPQVKGNIWQFEAQKTGKIITVPLTGFAAPALDILEKYNYNLPVVANANYNIHLKQLCRLSGITEQVKKREFKGAKVIAEEVPKYKLVSSHTARRSCITFLLSRGVPPTTVMELTGHSDMKTLMKYYKPSPDFLVRAFESVGLLGEGVMRSA